MNEGQELHCYGVLVVLGQDRQGVLAEVMNLLHSYECDPGAKQRGVVDVTHLWVRSFGPVGGILLRIRTTDYQFRYLARRVNPACDKIIPGCTVRLRKAPRPWSLDPSSPSAFYYKESELPTPHSDERSSAIDPSHRVDDRDEMQRLGEAFNTIASDPFVDVSQYDYFYTRTGRRARKEVPLRSVHCLRIFDLNQRSPRWIKNTFEQAVRTAYELGPKAELGFVHIDDIPTKGSREISDISRRLYTIPSTRPHCRRQTDQGGKDFCYIRIHCVDDRGLLSFILGRLHSYRHTHVSFSRILRISTRGFGDDAVVMIATDWLPGGDENRLEAELRRSLDTFFAAQVRQSRFQRLAFQEPEPTVYDVSVFTSSKAPGIQLPVGFRLLCPRKPIAARNTSDIVAGLCARLEPYCVSGKASVLYCNARIVPSPMQTDQHIRTSNPGVIEEPAAEHLDTTSGGTEVSGAEQDLEFRLGIMLAVHNSVYDELQEKLKSYRRSLER